MNGRDKRKYQVWAIVLSVIMLSACQAAPAENYVQDKNDAFLSQTAADSSSSKTEKSTWETVIDVKAYPAQVEICAQMQKDARVYPVIEIEPAKMSQQQIDNFLSQFGETEYHLDHNLMTKADYQKVILELQRYLANKEYEKSTSDPDLQAELRESYEESIRYHQQWMQNAPETIDDVIEPVFTDEYFIQSVMEPEILIEADGSIVKNELSDSERYEELKARNTRRIQVKWDYDGKTHTLDALDDDVSLLGTSLRYEVERKNETNVSYIPNQGDLKGVELKYDDALQLAQNQIELLGLDSMVLAHSAKGVKFDVQAAYADRSQSAYTDQCYVFYFTRGVEGVPVTYASNAINYDRYDAPWDYERLCAVVDAEGVQSLSMDTSTAAGRTLVENADLLPVERIQEIAGEQFSVGNIALPAGVEMNANSQMKLTVNRAELGYARVKLADSSGRYALVPAWDFFGEYVLDTGEEGVVLHSYGDNSAYRYSYLTINAVDGTVIDRGLGY